MYSSSSAEVGPVHNALMKNTMQGTADHLSEHAQNSLYDTIIMTKHLYFLLFYVHMLTYY